MVSWSSAVFLALLGIRQAQAQNGITVQLYDTRDCSHLPSGQAVISPGTCNPTNGLAALRAAVTASCTVWVYSDDACSSSANAQLGFNDCWWIGNRGSYEVKCT